MRRFPEVPERPEVREDVVGRLSREGLDAVQPRAEIVKPQARRFDSQPAAFFQTTIDSTIIRFGRKGGPCRQHDCGHFISWPHLASALSIILDGKSAKDREYAGTIGSMLTALPMNRSSAISSQTWPPGLDIAGKASTCVPTANRAMKFV